MSATVYALFFGLLDSLSVPPLKTNFICFQVESLRGPNFLTPFTECIRALSCCSLVDGRGGMPSEVHFVGKMGLWSRGGFLTDIRLNALWPSRRSAKNVGQVRALLGVFNFTRLGNLGGTITNLCTRWLVLHSYFNLFFCSNSYFFPFTWAGIKLEEKTRLLRSLFFPFMAAEAVFCCLNTASRASLRLQLISHSWFYFLFWASLWRSLRTFNLIASGKEFRIRPQI